MSAYEDVPLILLIAAGCIAGAIETTAMWPTEYIKTQLQLQHPPIKKVSSPLNEKDGVMNMMEEEEEEAGKPPPYTRMIPGIIYTVHMYGLSALYHGLAPSLLGSIPKAGIRFGFDAWFGKLLRDDEGNLSIGMYFIAGLFAGIVEALVIVAPAETIKTKCIELNMSFLRGLQEILINEGIRGIYRGVFATVLKQGSNQALRFVWYHEYKLIVTNDGANTLTLAQSFIGGMTAGIFSTLVNQPFDVLKTRLQGIHAKEQYSSTWDCVYKTYSTEGISGFYKGIIPRLTRVIPGQGILFMSFESAVGILITIFGS